MQSSEHCPSVGKGRLHVWPSSKVLGRTLQARRGNTCGLGEGCSLLNRDHSRVGFMVPDRVGAV